MAFLDNITNKLSSFIGNQITSVKNNMTPESQSFVNNFTNYLEQKKDNIIHGFTNNFTNLSEKKNNIETIKQNFNLQNNPNAQINILTGKPTKYTDLFIPATKLVSTFADNIIQVGKKIGYYIPPYVWEKSQAEKDAEQNVYIQDVFNKQRKQAADALIKNPNSPNKEALLKIISTSTAPNSSIPEEYKTTPKEMIGEFGGLALDIATLGTFPAGAKILGKLPKAVKYMIESGVIASGYGISEGLKEDKKYRDIAKQAGLYGAGGLVLGIGLFGADKLVNRLVQRNAISKIMQQSDEVKYILNKTNKKINPIIARDALDDAALQIQYHNGNDPVTKKILENLKNIDTSKVSTWDNLTNIATKDVNKNITQDIINHINTRRVWMNEPLFVNELVKKNKLNITENLFEPISNKIINNKDILSGTISKEAKPFLGKIVNDIKPIMDILPENFNAKQYVNDLISKRELARKGKQLGIVEKSSDFYRNLKSKFVDFASPIEDLIAQSQKKYKFEVLPKFDITNQIDRTLRAPVIAGQFMKDNGLDVVIKEAKNLNYLDQYLIAKQATKVAQQGIKTGRDYLKDQYLIKRLSPIYESLAQRVTQYSQKLLDYTVDAGMVNKELANKLKEIYPDYVPLNRIFNELEKQKLPFGTKAIASLSKQTIVQKLQGSTREIESPIASLMEKTTQAFVQGEKNKSAKILAGYKDLPGMKEIIRELPEGERATNKFSFIDNGIKRTFETTKEIASAAKALNVQQMNILGKILSVPVRIAKVGITGLNPAFILSNIARDQQLGFITAKHASSLANPATFTRSLYEAIGHGKLYQEIIRQGAGGTSFDIAREQIPQTIKKVRASRNIATKVLYTITHPNELFRTAENIIGRSEEFTRIQQFQAARKSLINSGRTLEDANILAAKAARENTANFMRRGEWGTVLNSAFLYLNASIQGSRAFIRAMGRSPVKTSAKIATTLFAPMAVITAYNLSDDARREAYMDIPDYEKDNNLLLIPPQPVKDENGKWNVIKIPLPPGLNKLTIPIRKIVEQTQGLDPVKFKDFANGIIGSVIPVEPEGGSLISTFTPQAIKPTLEAYVNKNFFTGLPQVSQSMEKLSPELQVKKDTSGTAQIIANAFKISPIKTEEFIKGTFGGLSENVLNLTDRALVGLDVMPEDKIGGKSFIESIKKRFIKASGGQIEQKQSQGIEDLITQQSDQNFKLKQEAELLDQELQQLPKDEANAKFKTLMSVNPQLANTLKDTVEERKLGLSYSEKLIKMLWVSNGERAMYIHEQAMKLKTSEERNAYIKDLVRKKIVSAEVIQQLRELASTGELQQSIAENIQSKTTSSLTSLSSNKSDTQKSYSKKLKSQYKK